MRFLEVQKWQKSAIDKKSAFDIGSSRDWNIIYTFFIGSYSLHSFHEGLNRNLETYTEEFFWKTLISVPFAGFLIVWSFQKNANSFDFSRYSNSNF